MLVVPSVDDIFDWERRLAREQGAFLGGRIMHFKDLVDEVLSEGSQTRPTASAVQRRYLVGEAIATAWPRISERIERQPGLVDAMLDLIDEFRNASIGPDALDLAVEDVGGGYLQQIAGVYREYLNLLGGYGMSDHPALALRATQTGLEAWQGRPIFVAGFDDMSNTQLDLLERLAAQTDVTIAITHELGNSAMAVTEKLLGRLEERGAKVRHSTDRPDQPIDHDPLLFEIERNFGLRRRGEIVPGDAFTVMRSSGKRGEAEAIAAQIATLVADGTDPGQIAVAVATPANNGTGFRDLLDEYSIPVTLESETPAASTATGQAIVSLLKAVSPGGSAADLISYLRGPVGVDQGQVDQLEGKVLQKGLSSASEAAGLYRDLSGGELPPDWAELTTGAGKDIPVLVSALAQRIAARILSHFPDAVPDASLTTETQIATAISRACAELKQIRGRPATTLNIAEALASGAIKTWAIPTQSTVRIASPYSLRAKRFEYLFIASLQERAFSDSDRAGPFLSPEARSAIGLPDFTDPELQELYLFYSCLSVPTRGLWISSRVADESGKAEYPSPLVSQVERLFDTSKVPLKRADRPSSAITFPAHRAPSLTELIRTLCASDATKRSEIYGSLELTGREIEIVDEQISAAAQTEGSTRTLADLSGERALELIADGPTFSATAIESYLSCPYRWFIERVLRPLRFGPDPEPLARGNLVHAALASIYESHPGEIPRPDSLEDWTQMVVPVVNRIAGRPGIDLGADSPAHRIVRRQVANSISTWLSKESQRESPGFLPLEMEAKFGMGKDGRPALQMNGWSLRGSIDRIDTSGEAGVGVGMRGVVLDYKTGKASAKSWAHIKRDRKVQLQLYMYALRQIWKIEPSAGLYVPIVVGKSAIRGLVDAEFASDVVDLNAQGRDRESEFGGAINDAIALSDQAVAAMMAGRIGHDPNTCPNHLSHAAVPDWVADVSGNTGSEVANER